MEMQGKTKNFTYSLPSKISPHFFFPTRFSPLHAFFSSSSSSSRPLPPPPLFLLFQDLPPPITPSSSDLHQDRHLFTTSEPCAPIARRRAVRNPRSSTETRSTRRRFLPCRSNYRGHNPPPRRGCSATEALEVAPPGDNQFGRRSCPFTSPSCGIVSGAGCPLKIPVNMQPTGRGQIGQPTVPGRPVSPFAVSQSRAQPIFSGTSVDPQAPGAPQASPPFYSGPPVRAQTPVSRFVPPNGPSVSLPRTYQPINQPSDYLQPSQQFPSSNKSGYAQPPSSSVISHVSLPPVGQILQSSANQHVPLQPVSQTPLPLLPAHASPPSPMVQPTIPPPPVRSSFPPPAGTRFPPAPPVGTSFFPTRPISQGPLQVGPPPLSRSELPVGANTAYLQPGTNITPPSFSGYPLSSSSLEPSYPAPGSFPQAFHSKTTAQGPYAFNAPQIGSLPAPGAPPSSFSSREQFPRPSSGPPLGSMLQGLVEEFQSLSVKSTPGSADPGIDFHSLPRPHDDAEPTNVLETYPMNCHPRYFRLTTHAMPNSQSLFGRWHLPLGAVVHPLAEAPDGEEVPVINFGPAGVIRCRRCRTYVNPYVTFTDAGRKWRCNLCSLLNDVPAEYFCILDASGKRCDIDQRPELTRGSVEFVAPTEYMVRPPMPPLYFFLIDVSMSAVSSGMLEIVAKAIKSCLDNLQGYPRTQIGFLTFDSTLHFYNLKSSLTQPQMMVVADLDDIFVPLPDDLLVNLSDSRSVVDAFLDSLPSMFQDNINVESSLGPALKAAFMVMSQLGGKLSVFQSTLPSLGIGRLKLRGDDLRIYGTDKEHTLRTPEDPFYKQMAAEFTKYQIGVDMYAISDKYCDVASLGSLAKYTGGQVYYYPSFQAHLHEGQLKHDITRDLTRETAWESVMRIRCGKGIRFVTYHGHFMLRSTDLLALPAVDCDKAFAMQLTLEDTLMTTQTVYFQVALLYTSSSGERRIRVHTAAAPVVSDLGEMYRQADVGTVVSLMSRLAIEKTMSQKLEDARQFVQLKIVKALKEYRNLYVVQHRLGNRFIFPESLKFLPLYGLALCKSLALRGGYADAFLDERCAAGYTMMILPVKRVMKLLHPSLIKIDDIILEVDSQKVDDLGRLKQLPLTATSLDPKSLYLFEDGFRFVIWFGRMLSPNVITSILGDISGFPDLSKIVLVKHENKVSENLIKILERFRERKPECYQLCHFIRQGEQPRESVLLLNNLIEDQIGGMSGYLEWIVQLYRQTQQNP